MMDEDSDFEVAWPWSRQNEPGSTQQVPEPETETETETEPVPEPESEPEPEPEPEQDDFPPLLAVVLQRQQDCAAAATTVSDQVAPGPPATRGATFDISSLPQISCNIPLNMLSNQKVCSN